MIRGRLCISCYNRDREVRIGRNAKGGRPLLTDALHPERMIVISDDGPETTEFPAVTGLVEAMITVANSATGPIAFGRPVVRSPLL